MSSAVARLLACTLLICGCGSEPDDRIFNTYVLVGVDGNPLPYLASSDADCDLYIAEGELVLNEGGTYTMEFMGPLDCSRSGGPSEQSFGRNYVGTFTESGGTLQFTGPLQGGGTLEFTGTVNPLEATVTAPPIPPQTGPDLELQFAVSRVIDQ
jgi:hypothetical protein